MLGAMRTAAAPEFGEVTEEATWGRTDATAPATAEGTAALVSGAPALWLDSLCEADGVIGSFLAAALGT